jgi:tetratricopeptide (TPR) repeat protein
MRDWPADARAYFLQTQVELRDQSPLETILKHYRAALDRDPNLDQARLELANLLRKSHRNADAMAEYTIYLGRKPDNPLGHLGAGQNAMDLGDLAQGIHHLEQAESLAPRDSVILGARATLEISRKRFDAALDYLDRAVEVDPFDLSNRYQRMLVLTQQGKTSLADAERQTLNRLRNDEETFAKISQQLKHRPLDLHLRSQAARWLMDHGHQAEAVEWAKLVLRSSPSDREMNRLLADHYRQQGMTGLANFHATHAVP